MILLDPRVGSGELLKLFQPFGVTVTITKLEFGDMAWEGKGPSGACMVVVERKRIDDLIQSMHSRRLSGHQLPGMAENYDYGYLIVEGVWRPGSEGEMQVMQWGKWQRRGVHTRAVNNYLMGLSLRAGLIVWRTGDERETVGWVVDQYRMWTEKEWGEHRSHDQVYAPADRTGGRVLSFRPRKIGLVEKVGMQLPGVDTKARKVAERFASVEDMVAADEKEWARVEGIGKVGAKRIWAALRGQ